VPVPKIKIVVLGYSPPTFDVRALTAWKSQVFSIDPAIETFQLNQDGQGPDWEYTDQQLAGQLKRPADCDLLVIFLKVKLEDNWYARRLDDNRVLFTFYELDQILQLFRLPLQNLALRVLYAMTLVYKRYGDRIPPLSEPTNFAHDETRGCLFYMNASKIDVIHSLDRPRLCDHCVSQLKQSRVSNETLDVVAKELRRIRKPLADRIVTFVRDHTMWSIFIYVISALMLGTVASVLASYIYAYLHRAT
jgi:hypothetical protein